MADSYFVLLKALIARLRADSTLTALVGGRVYSNMPPEVQTTFPFVFLDIESSPYAGKDFTDMEHLVEIKAFDRGSSPKTVSDIRSAIYSSLDRIDGGLSLDSGRVVSVQFTGTSVTFKENDGVTWQTVIHFRILIA